MCPEENFVCRLTPNHYITSKGTETKREDEEKNSRANDLRSSSSTSSSSNDGNEIDQRR